MNSKKQSKLAYLKYMFFLVLFFLLSSLPDVVMFILSALEFNDWVIAVVILFINYFIIKFLYKRYINRSKGNFFENEDLISLNWKKIFFVLLMYGVISFLDLIFSHSLDIGTPENQEIIEEMFRMTPITIAVSTVLVAPVVEELIFRGFFFAYFMKKDTFSSKLMIVIISSLVFGLAHEFYPSISLLYYSSIGAVLALTYLYTKNIKYSILLHLINNLVATCLMFSS